MALQLQKSQYLTTPSGGLPPNATAWTIGTWVQRDVNTSDGQVVFILANLVSSYYVIVEWDNASFDQFGWAHDANTSGALVATIPVGTPFYCAVIATSLSTTRLYWRFPWQRTLNVANFTTTRTAFTPDTLYFGQQPTGTHELMYGRLANVMCWSRALSVTELLTQSYQSRPISANGLKFWWPLRTADQPFDASGNGNHPILSAPCVTVPEVVPYLDRRVSLRKANHYGYWYTAPITITQGSRTLTSGTFQSMGSRAGR